MANRIKIGGMSADSLLLPDTASLPEKDRPVPAAAIHHHGNILVTGDRTHFGQFYGKKILGVSILSPAMLAEMVLGKKCISNMTSLIFRLVAHQPKQPLGLVMQSFGYRP